MGTLAVPQKPGSSWHGPGEQDKATTLTPRAQTDTPVLFWAVYQVDLAMTSHQLRPRGRRGRGRGGDGCLPPWLLVLQAPGVLGFVPTDS